MSDTIVLRNCAPTLAGIKTGSLFTCPFTDCQEMRESIRRWNHMLAGKGLRVLPLRWRCGRALIYLYRVSQLAQDLQQNRAKHLLTERGYSCGVPERCIAQLVRRLCEDDSFPHEIGLFLGYPPEDVCGFIENRAGGCKCGGCWKVYGDADAARRVFAKYKKCTRIYCTLYAKGRSVERLIVAG